jgi:hypothetical protein
VAHLMGMEGCDNFLLCLNNQELHQLSATYPDDAKLRMWLMSAENIK